MSEYAEREAPDHVSAMTGEGLHSKSAIAAELAYRVKRTVDLEKQLAERDAALARCVEALISASETLWNYVVPGTQVEAGVVVKAAIKVAESLASIPASTQATAKVLAAAQETQEKYNELLYGVSIKHPNETRHETALRYIRQAEYPQSTSAKVQQWQPIETAPKNGTNILLVNRIGNVATGLWQGNGEYEGWWLRGGNRPNTFFNHHYGPSYWMPLPEPPTEAIREEKEGE